MIYLLDTNVGMPIESWLGIVVAVVGTLIGSLLRDSYQRVVKRIENLEERTAELSDVQEEIKIRAEQDMRGVDTKISTLHLTILSKLDEIKDKFNDFRK